MDTSTASEETTSSTFETELVNGEPHLPQLTWELLAKAGRVDKLTFRIPGTMKTQKVECVILSRVDVIEMMKKEKRKTTLAAKQVGDQLREVIQELPNSLGEMTDYQKRCYRKALTLIVNLEKLCVQK